MAELGPETLRRIMGRLLRDKVVHGAYNELGAHAAAWEAERIDAQNSLALMTAERDALWSELQGHLGEMDSGDG